MPFEAIKRQSGIFQYKHIEREMSIIRTDKNVYLATIRFIPIIGMLL